VAVLPVPMENVFTSHHTNFTYQVTIF